MAAKHTPGPWTFEHVSQDVVDIKSDGPKWKAVATIKANKLGAGEVGADELSSNARLIAAAPDLLAACEKAADAFDALAEVNNLPSGWKRSVVDPIRAAIAKAT